MLEEDKEKQEVVEEINQNEKIKDLDTNIEVSQKSKFLKIVKMILLIISSPIWFPWKVLFVRRKGNKFSEVSTGKQIFRVIRSFITKPLKFVIYLAIIGLEFLIVYKVRYSFLTYPITKGAVENYYLKDETIKEEHKDGFKDVFAKVDDWDLDAKNKMYVVMDSYIAKYSIDRTDDKTVTLFLDKFNNDDDFRNDVHDIVKNVDKTLTRSLKELSKLEGFENSSVVSPALNVGAQMIDYRQALDLLGNSISLIDDDIEILNVNEDSLEETVSVMAEYSRGKSLDDLN